MSWSATAAEIRPQTSIMWSNDDWQIDRTKGPFAKYFRVHLGRADDMFALYARDGSGWRFLGTLDDAAAAAFVASALGMEARS